MNGQKSQTLSLQRAAKSLERCLKLPKYQINEELRILKDHLHRAHMQFRAFKHAREEAVASTSTITLHINYYNKPERRKAPITMKHRYRFNLLTSGMPKIDILSLQFQITLAIMLQQLWQV